MEGRMNRTGVYMEWNRGIGKKRGGGEYGGEKAKKRVD